MPAMTQYGPPQKYKEVNILTGEEKQFILKNVSLEPIPVETYQSTGHTINGQELFFGDVVLIDGEMRTVEWDSTWFAIVTVKDGKMKPLEWMMPDVILGNVHTPQEVLKQRAEELKDART